MGRILSRIYADFFKGSRYNEYEKIIVKAIESGYKIVSLIDYYGNFLEKDEKVIILRHDIDTDPKGARNFFEIEKRFGVKASYYFRLNTLDYKFMDEIKAYGSEVGYHYEELATYCKRNGIRGASELGEKDYENIYNEFVNNFKDRFKDYNIKSIASHGDFYNRKIKVPNYRIFELYNYADLGISIEAYDEKLLKSFDKYVSDARLKPYWKDGYSMFDAINEGQRKVLFLSHPANWGTNVLENIYENLKRAINIFF